MNTAFLEFGTTVLAGGQRTFIAKGELDMAVSGSFNQALLDAIATTQPGAELLVDLREVRFFDVVALRGLVSAARAAQDAGVPFRVAASAAVNRVFDVLELDTVRVLGGSVAASAAAGSRGAVLRSA